MVMQQQQQTEHEFVNNFDTLNSINNNKFNNGHDEDIFRTQEQFEAVVVPSIQIDEQQNGLTSNDTNNNSNDNFGPETDVDAIEDLQASSPLTESDCVKEKFQVELKETEDIVVGGGFADETMNFGAGVDVEAATNAFLGNLEDKIFEELTQQHPDLTADINPFAAESNLVEAEHHADDGFMDDKNVEVHHGFDEMDKLLSAGRDHFEQFTDDIVQKTNEFITMEATKSVVDDMMSANEHVEAEINMQEHMPEHGEL